MSTGQKLRSYKFAARYGRNEGSGGAQAGIRVEDGSTLAGLRELRRGAGRGSIPSTA
jgi:hypothetical protein